ncbi:unnamed protein product [Penicillium salamii]|nr:unnamed protein product [Penicillium salamii]
MFFFGLGKLFYVIILIINAIAILSEDRFLARVGWGRTQAEPGFGASYDSTSVKAKTINLIASVRTVMRSTFPTGTPRIVLRQACLATGLDGVLTDSPQYRSSSSTLSSSFTS